MSSEFTIYKDTNQTVEETIAGVDLQAGDGATIKWLLVAVGTDLSGDLDAITGLVEKTTGDGVTVTAATTYDVALVPADTEDLRPDDYWVVARVTLSGGSILPIPKYTVTLSA